LRKAVVVAGLVTSGSLTVGPQSVDMSKLQNVTISIETGNHGMSGPARASRYLKLRESIVSAGIPLLDDDELRQEIRERKGLTRV
jgi:hypothetical protein